jgi:hypothetical protein
MSNVVNNDLVRSDLVYDQVAADWKSPEFWIARCRAEIGLLGDQRRCLFDPRDELGRCAWLVFRNVCKNLFKDRRARRARTEASCVAVAAEECLNFLIAREVSPRSAFFDNSPLVFGQVIAVAPLLDLAGEARNFLLVCLGPGQHAIENFLNLLFRHDEDIADASGACHGPS